jgi:hypothetical protein
MGSDGSSNWFDLLYCQILDFNGIVPSGVNEVDGCA